MEKNVDVDDSNISKRLFSGGIWNTVSEFGAQIINFVITIILARLLLPEHFGLMGKVIVITGFLGYVTEFGIQPTLIENKWTDKARLSTAFWTSLFISIAFYIIVYTSAPLIVDFYDDERLLWIVRLLFVDFLLKPLSFVPNVLEELKLRYDRIAKINLMAIFISGAVGVAVAYAGKGVWALVVQHIVRSAIFSISLLLWVGWYPGKNFSFKDFKRIIKSGFHYTVNNLVIFASENTDFLLVGRFMGDAPLGYYTLSFRLTRYPLAKVWGVFGRMLFPAFSLMRDDERRAAYNYVRVSITGGFFIGPFLVMLFFGARAIISIVVGDQWLPSVPIMQILVFFVLLSSMSMGDAAVLMSKGLVKLVNLSKVIESVLLLSLGLIVLRMGQGIQTMAIVYVSSVAAGTFLLKAIVLKKLSVSHFRYIQVFIIILLYLGVLSVCAYFYMELADTLIQSDVVMLLGLGALMVVLVLVLNKLFSFVTIHGRKVDLNGINKLAAWIAE